MCQSPATTAGAEATNGSPPSPVAELPSAHESGTFAGLLSDLAEAPPFGEVFESPATSVAGDGAAEAEDDEVWHDFQLEIRDLLRPGAHDELLSVVRQHIKSRLTPKHIILRDRITFIFSSADIFLSAYCMGAFPQTYYKLFSFQIIFLLALRWIYYRSKRQHYYFFDICYWAAALLLVQLQLFPTSIALAKVTFAFALGPLLWSILAFRNSLVFHSLDKFTSFWLHWFPATVCFAFRWHPPPPMAQLLASDPSARARWDSASPWELCVLPMGPYIAWATLYYLKIFLVSSRKIRERGYETLFGWVTTRKGLFATVVLRFPRPLQPLAYLSLHMVLTASAMTFNCIWWRSQWAGAALIVAAFILSAWNGATYYFEVFAHRYLAAVGVERRRSKSPAVGGAKER